MYDFIDREPIRNICMFCEQDDCICDVDVKDDTWTPNVIPMFKTRACSCGVEVQVPRHLQEHLDSMIGAEVLCQRCFNKAIGKHVQV